MKPEEAKTKWCPHKKVALSEGMAANWTGNMGGGGYGDIVDDTRCIASDCMMWQWFIGSHDGKPTFSTEQGYCGLAGYNQ